MENFAVANQQGGVFVFIIRIRDLLDPFTLLLYDNLEADESLRISRDSFLIYQQIFIKSEIVPCIRKSSL